MNFILLSTPLPFPFPFQMSTGKREKKSERGESQIQKASGFSPKWTLSPVAAAFVYTSAPPRNRMDHWKRSEEKDNRVGDPDTGVGEWVCVWLILGPPTNPPSPSSSTDSSSTSPSSPSSSHSSYSQIPNRLSRFRYTMEEDEPPSTSTSSESPPEAKPSSSRKRKSSRRGKIFALNETCSASRSLQDQKPYNAASRNINFRMCHVVSPLNDHPTVSRNKRPRWLEA